MAEQRTGFDSEEPETEQEGPLTIVEQPRNRGIMSVSTISLNQAWNLHNIADQGIDILRGTDEINIQQMVELHEMLANVQSENRYKIYIPSSAETIFYASETSNNYDRVCCGSNRSFTMTLYDQSHREAVIIRRLPSVGCCSLWCKINQLEVFLPQGELIGRVRQTDSLFSKTFQICDVSERIGYVIDGYSSTADRIVSFGIYSADGCTRLGNISHQWDQLQNEYNTSLKFPSSRDPNKMKILIISAAFLLEYIYFMPVKSGSRLCR